MLIRFTGYQEHPFLVRDRTLEVDMVGWVARAIETRDARIRQQQEQQKQQAQPHTEPPRDQQ